MNYKDLLKYAGWISPLFVLLINTKEAVTDGYNEKNLKDTGHRVIRFVDMLIISVSWFSAVLMLHPEFTQTLVNTENKSNSIFLELLFPYTTNIPLAIILYLNSFVLFLYNKNRKHIIRFINRVSGDW